MATRRPIVREGGRDKQLPAGDTLPDAALSANLQALGGLTGAADRVPYFTAPGVMTVGVMTAAGRALLDDADATAQRVTLGLGSAATATVTTSTGDTTAQRVTRVGDGGLLGDGLLADPSTANRVSGLYAFGSSSDLVPSAASVYLSIKYSGLDRKLQLGAAVTGAENYYLRSQLSDGVFTPTRSLWHSGNLINPYSRTNILGTVSQSGGVPTGAIIERGSNANGEYVRWADGTQICTHAITSTATDIPTAFQGGFRSIGLVWTFPAAFTTAAVVHGSTTSVSDGFAVQNVTASPTTTNTYVFTAVTTQASATRTARLGAIGRWF